MNKGEWKWIIRCGDCDYRKSIHKPNCPASGYYKDIMVKVEVN